MGAAPGLAARSYAARLNKLLDAPKTVAALLFDTQPMELTVHIDASHDHSTLSALAITKAVEVVSIKRPNARTPNLEVKSSVKVAMGDQLTLRAPIHVLASVAIPKGGKITLAPRHAREKITPLIRTERHALLAAANKLHTSMMPLMRARAEDARERQKVRRAITRLQAAWRGVALRATTSGMLQMTRTRNRAAKLRSKRLLASMLRAAHEAPICHPACFTKPTAEELAASAETRAAWASAHPDVAMVYAAQASTVRAHTATLNRHLAAAPEARKVLRGLPWSPLRVLHAPPLELTVSMDKRGNNTTVGALKLPEGLSVTKLRVNSRVIAAPKNATSLATQKLLDGDQLTIRGRVHELAGVCETRQGKLLVCPAKDRKAEGLAKLEREREMMHAAAGRLASVLQKRVRARLALRDEHRRSHAALVIQIAYAGHMADTISHQLTARVRAFEEARRGATARASAAAAAAASPEPPSAYAAYTAAGARSPPERKHAAGPMAAMELPALPVVAADSVVSVSGEDAAAAKAVAHDEEEAHAEAQAEAQAEAGSDEASDGDTWIADCILARRRLKPPSADAPPGEWHYLIRWVGKPPVEDRWVPASALDPAFVRAELEEAPPTPTAPPAPAVPAVFGPLLSPVAESAASSSPMSERDVSGRSTPRLPTGSADEEAAASSHAEESEEEEGEMAADAVDLLAEMLGRRPGGKGEHASPSPTKQQPMIRVVASGTAGMVEVS